ncbi:carbohydrate kinase family protein, partial [Patescibacteria group bacterium]|nr:carbohydrate kinase family protein [Patescibacteria group bacterium]
MIEVTGSLAFDHIMDYQGHFGDHIMPDKIHQINLSFLVNTVKKQKGGTAGNIAYNLALLKMPVSILAMAGADFTDYAGFLKDAGVDISQIQISQNNLTSSCYIMTDASDNQITAFYPGAMKEADKLSMDKEKCDFAVISPNKPEAMINLTGQCQKLGIPYMLDPGMQLPALSSDDLKNMVNGAEILIGNDYEMALLSEKCRVPASRQGGQSAELLQTVKILVTTLGAKGSTIQTADKTYTIPSAKPAEVLDPTGAGDAYRAGFLAGYLKDLDLQICGQMGAVSACYAIEKYGTTSHTFTLEEFKKRYKENFNDEI